MSIPSRCAEPLQPCTAVDFDVDDDESHGEGVSSHRTPNLRSTYYSKAYRRSLADAYNQFCGWLAMLFPSFCLDRAASSSALVSELLIDYVQHLYTLKKPVTLASDTILSVRYRYRRLKGQLRSSWDSIFSWRAELPVRLRVPMTEVILQAICRYARFRAITGGLEAAALWLPFSVALRAGFWGLLRPGEIAGLTRRRIQGPSDFAA